jgi:polyhydroxybutyrate depolymerase
MGALMKALVIGVLLALAAAANHARAGDSRLTDVDIAVGDVSRNYLVHLPHGYEASRPLPLVLALHGGGGSAAHMSRDRLYGLLTKSDQSGFIVAFPNGSSRFPGGKLATWNAGLCCGYARDRNVEDVEFLKAVVADVKKRYAVDNKRVYAIGMSNGAMMAYRLACEAPEVFSAIMAVAGTDNMANCRPSSPVSVLHVHALNDDHVLFNGGAGPSAVSRRLITDFRSVPETIKRWAENNQCMGKPVRSLEVNGAYCEDYSDCAGDSRVRLCVTEHGAHSWPRGSKPQGDESPSRAISANDVMWDFFSR